MYILILTFNENIKSTINYFELQQNKKIDFLILLIKVRGILFLLPKVLQIRFTYLPEKILKLKIEGFF